MHSPKEICSGGAFLSRTLSQKVKTESVPKGSSASGRVEQMDFCTMQCKRGSCDSRAGPNPPPWREGREVSLLKEVPALSLKDNEDLLRREEGRRGEQGFRERRPAKEARRQKTTGWAQCTRLHFQYPSPVSGTKTPWRHAGFRAGAAICRGAWNVLSRQEHELGMCLTKCWGYGLGAQEPMERASSGQSCNK